MAAIDIQTKQPYKSGGDGGDELPPNGEKMTQITREEFDAKLQLLQKEMEHKDKLFDQKLDAFLGKQALHDDKFLILAQQSAETAKKAENLKTHLWTSALAIGLTAIAAMAGSYYSSQQILLSASQIVSDPLKDDIKALSESQKTLADSQRALSKDVEAIRAAVEKPSTSSGTFNFGSPGSFSKKPEPDTKNSFVIEK